MLNHKSAQSSPASRGGIGTVGYVVATGVILLRELQPGELRQAAVLSEFVGVDRARPSVVLGAHRLSAAPRSGRPGARRAER
jgi:hypothetical protein